MKGYPDTEPIAVPSRTTRDIVAASGYRMSTARVREGEEGGIRGQTAEDTPSGEHVRQESLSGRQTTKSTRPGAESIPPHAPRMG
jgi:hypothetical protein